MNLDIVLFIAVIVFALTGALYLFFGYRLLRLLVAVSAFLITGTAGYILITRLASLLFIINIAIAVAAGILFGLLIYYIYYAGAFFVGLTAGGILCFFMIDYFSLPVSTVVYVAVIVICIVAGSLSSLMKKPILIGFTAFNGASAVAVSAGYLLFLGLDPSDFSVVSLVNNPVSPLMRQYFLPIMMAIAGLLILGVFIQTYLTGKQQSFIRPRYIGKHRKH